MMYKNKYGSFAKQKFSNEYVLMTAEEEKAFNKYGADAFIVKDGQCVLDPDFEKKKLDELKAEKRVEINKARDEAEQGGFEYMGKTFDSDQVSAQRISMATQAMALAPNETKITWTTQDNSTIELNKTELVGLVVALAEWSNTCHKKATALKEEIDKAKTAEELEKIKWED